jgi:hypothetical protein
MRAHARVHPRTQHYQVNPRRGERSGEAHEAQRERVLADVARPVHLDQRPPRRAGVTLSLLLRRRARCGGEGRVLVRLNCHFLGGGGSSSSSSSSQTGHTQQATMSRNPVRVVRARGGTRATQHPPHRCGSHNRIRARAVEQRPRHDARIELPDKRGVLLRSAVLPRAAPRAAPPPSAALPCTCSYTASCASMDWTHRNSRGYTFPNPPEIIFAAVKWRPRTPCARAGAR